MTVFEYYMEPKDGEIFCATCGTANDTTNGEMHCEGCGGYLGKIFCGVCDKFIGEEERYALSRLPHESDINDPFLKNYPSAIYFCCEEHALIGSRKLYDIFGITLKLPSALLNEKCGNCGTPFDADVWNETVLVLTAERGPRNKPETLGEKYLAHFCPTCRTSGFWVSADVALQGCNGC